MRTRHLSLVVLLFLFLATGVDFRDRGITAGTTRLEAQQSLAVPLVPLPNRDGSFKFGVLGDFGTGSTEQYQLAEQMVTLHGRFKYDSVVLVGDNLYGSERPQDFKTKFELP